MRGDVGYLLYFPFTGRQRGRGRGRLMRLSVTPPAQAVCGMPHCLCLEVRGVRVEGDVADLTAFSLSKGAWWPFSLIGARCAAWRLGRRRAPAKAAGGKLDRVRRPPAREPVQPARTQSSSAGPASDPRSSFAGSGTLHPEYPSALKRCRTPLGAKVPSVRFPGISRAVAKAIGE